MMTSSDQHTISRRQLLGLSAALVLVAACGGDDGDDRADGASTTGGGTTRPPTTGGTSASDPTPDTSADVTTGGDDDERVVVLVPALLDAALALGVTPIAAPGVGDAFPAHLGEKTAGIEMLDLSAGPNLELIATLRPSLIITQSGEGNAADQLAQIADTVEVDFPIPASAWPDYVAAVATALGRDDALPAVIAEHEARVAVAAATLAPALAGKQLSLLRLGDGTVRQYGPDSFAGSILVAAGVQHREPPAGTEWNSQGYTEVSMERLADLARDVVVVFQIGSEAQDALTSDPLWNGLPAVQSGAFAFVDQSHWLHIGYQSAAQVLNDATRLLA